MSNFITDNINTIINGDCLDIMKEMDDNFLDMVITSPPYNLDISYNSYDDKLPYDEYLDFTDKWIELCYKKLKKDGRIAINIPLETNLNGKKFICNDYMNILKNNNFIEMAFVLWDKQNVTSRTAWGSFCSPSQPHIIQPMECILIYAKETKKKEGNKSNIDIEKEEFIKYSLGIWNIQPEFDRSHPAPFPVTLPNRLIKFFTYKNDIVCDPFSGSGTTAIACHNLNRNFICIEKDVDYYNASVERLNNAKAQLKLF